MHWDTYLVDLDIPKEWKCTSHHHDELPSYQVNGLHIWMGSHDANVREADAKNIWGTDWGTDNGTMTYGYPPKPLSRAARPALVLCSPRPLTLSPLRYAPHNQDRFAYGLHYCCPRYSRQFDG